VDRGFAAAENEVVLELDLATVEPSLAGPRRPQDRVGLAKVGEEFARSLNTVFTVIMLMRRIRIS